MLNTNGIYCVGNLSEKENNVQDFGPRYCPNFQPYFRSGCLRTPKCYYWKSIMIMLEKNANYCVESETTKQKQIGCRFQCFFQVVSEGSWNCFTEFWKLIVKMLQNFEFCRVVAKWQKHIQTLGPWRCFLKDLENML